MFKGVVGSGRVAKLSQVMVANGFNNLASLAITVHAARHLGPAAFGALGLVIAIVSFGSVILDSGISVALVRNYNSNSDLAKRESLVGAVLKAKLLQVLGAAILAYPLACCLRYFLPVLTDVELVTVGILSAALMSLWGSVRALEQARRDYASFTRYVLLYGVLRFIAYALILLFHQISPMSTILSLYVAPLSVLLLYTLALRERAALGMNGSRLRWECAALWGALKYGVWIASSAILFSLVGRLPLFALARRSSPKELGLYTAAMTFVGGFGLVWDALSTVIVPEVSGLQTPESRLRFRKLLYRKLPNMFLLLAAVFAGCMLAQRFLLGPAYRGSLATFAVIGSATILCMCISVNNNLVHAYGIPQMLTYMNCCRLLAILALLGVVSQPHALNVAMIYAAVLLAGDLGLFIYLHRRTREERDSIAAATA